jgi:hypothetical protein
MSDRIDPAMNGVQGATLHPSFDCARAEADFEQLPSADHAVLPLRKARHRAIEATRALFSVSWREK